MAALRQLALTLLHQTRKRRRIDGTTAIPVVCQRPSPKRMRRVPAPATSTVYVPMVRTDGTLWVCVTTVELPRCVLS